MVFHKTRISQITNHTRESILIFFRMASFTIHCLLNNIYTQIKVNHILLNNRLITKLHIQVPGLQETTNYPTTIYNTHATRNQVLNYLRKENLNIKTIPNVYL